MPPWYKAFERALAPTDNIAKALLVLIIIITILLLLFGDRVTRAVWLVYLASP